MWHQVWKYKSSATSHGFLNCPDKANNHRLRKLLNLQIFNSFNSHSSVYLTFRLMTQCTHNIIFLILPIINWPPDSEHRQIYFKLMVPQWDFQFLSPSLPRVIDEASKQDEAGGVVEDGDDEGPVDGELQVRWETCAPISFKLSGWERSSEILMLHQQ